MEGVATGICSGSTADLRSQEWTAAGVFFRLWQEGLEQTLHESGFTAHIRPEAKTAKAGVPRWGYGLYGSTGPAKPHLSVLGRGEEAQASAGFQARRRVVERTHSWMNRLRRISVRWDKSPDYTPSLHSACALIALRTARSGVCLYDQRNRAVSSTALLHP